MASPVLPLCRPLLRVPPFPGARCRTLVSQSSPRAEEIDASFAEAKQALASARVGGAYWGGQPPLPPEPYRLVSVRGGAARAALLDRLRSTPPVLSVDFARDDRACDPWHLLSGATEVHADDNSELVIIAALASIPAFDPDGRQIDAEEVDNRLRRSLTAGQYVNPFSGAAINLAEAIEISAHWRRLIDANRPIAAAVGFASWKRKTAAPLLWGGSGRSSFGVPPRAVAAGAQVAAWKSRTPAATLVDLEQRGAELVEVEDGFIRSIGLGADCVPPLSLVVDRRGIYFDPHRPSDLEQLLETGSFPPDLTDRAARLRALIVAGGISKYATGTGRAERRDGRRHVLVPGQVEDDRSVQSGGGEVTTNEELLRRARLAAPGAYILYKPHPDVEAGHRVGVVPDAIAAAYADEVVRGAPVSALIDMVDEVHVNTSLAGFEALLRGKPVTTHGVPFYAGWGLTRDLGAVPERRRARRTLDELVAATLLLHPRYLDPISGLPCSAEVLVERLARGDAAANGLLVPLRRFQGLLKRGLASVARAVS
jgi:capsular polysaccharide export protein